MPGSYFCTDRAWLGCLFCAGLRARRTDKQSFNDKPTSVLAPAVPGQMPSHVPLDLETQWRYEETKRWAARKELFPQLSDGTIIFCCMNQLYKVRGSLPNGRQS